MFGAEAVALYAIESSGLGIRRRAYRASVTMPPLISGRKPKLPRDGRDHPGAIARRLFASLRHSGVEPSAAVENRSISVCIRRTFPHDPHPSRRAEENARTVDDAHSFGPGETSPTASAAHEPCRAETRR